MQRTFVGIKVVPELEMMDCINRLKNVLKEDKIKWVDPDNLHITLRFLGDTSPRQVQAITRILDDLVADCMVPEVVFKGLGIFGTFRDPKVIWIGMDPGRILPGLKNRLDRELTGIGFSKETRAFRPHLTLARVKYIRNSIVLKDQLMKYEVTNFQKVQIKELTYYESFLRPEGPSYLPLKQVSFEET